MSAQDSESSEQSDMNALVLQNKDMLQLMSLANLDLKLNKTSLLKINISEAINLVTEHLDQMEIRVYGNIVFAISKGILRTLNVITVDLKETIDLMRKGIKTARDGEQQLTKAVKAIKRDKMALPASTSDSRIDDLSVSTAEKARNIANKDNITSNDKFTPQRFLETDMATDSLPRQPDFERDLAGQGLDYGNDIGQGFEPLNISVNEKPFEISTPSRMGDFVSPMKQQQIYSNLDVYLESVKKGEQIIFQESEDDEDEEETVEEKRARGEARRRRRARRADTAVELQTRWDYDEKTNIEKIDEEKPTTDATLFVERMQAPFVQPIEQRLAVTLDHIIELFTMDNLIQFNQKVKALRDPQLRMGQTSEQRNREFLDHLNNVGFPADDQPVFPDAMDDMIDRSRLLQIDPEKTPDPFDKTILEPNEIERITLDLDRNNFDDKITASEVYDTIRTVSDQKGKKPKPVSFLKLVERKERPAKANMFYELLTLAKQSKVNLSQQKRFADIEITVA